MTIRSYEIFVAVCDEGSMSAAAARLYISQSAVSQSVREIETYYNVRLFERGPHKLALTPHGEELLKLARHLLAYNEYVESAMRSVGVRQKIRMGSMMPLYSCDLLVRYNQSLNNADLSVHTMKVDEIVSLLTSSGLDCAIVDSRVEREELEYLPVSQEDVGFICKRRSRLHPALMEEKPEISIYEFEKLPLILTDLCQEFHDKFLNELKWRGVSSKIVCTFSSSLDARYAVEQDIGVAMLSRNASRMHSTACSFFTVPEFNYKRIIYLVYPKEKAYDPEFSIFLEFVRAETPSMMRDMRAPLML